MNKRKLMTIGFAFVVISAAAVFAVDEYDEEPLVMEDADTEPIENYDILQTALEYGTLDVFTTMLRESDLAELLKSEGPFTVFMPDDSAFKALEAGWLKQLLADPKQINILLERHIVTDAAITFGREETVEAVSIGKDTLYIRADAEKVTVNDAEILDEEIECSNGIIHVIDKVLVTP